MYVLARMMVLILLLKSEASGQLEPVGLLPKLLMIFRTKHKKRQTFARNDRLDDNAKS